MLFCMMKTLFILGALWLKGKYIACYQSATQQSFFSALIAVDCKVQHFYLQFFICNVEWNLYFYYRSCGRFKFCLFEMFLFQFAIE